MAGILLRLKAAIAAFRNPTDFPGEVVFTQRQAYFNLLWSYYANTTFDDLSSWAKYREKFQLYRNIRSIYNPTRRLVNFYVAQVYPGVLSEDASKLPDGVQIAIPLSADTDEKLKMATAQFWQWSNWQSGNKLMVRYGGATGSCLVEVVDNTARGKVSASVRWPGLIAEQSLEGGPGLVLDDVGNVKFYALEYSLLDADGEAFTYRKEVDAGSFRYYRDDVPFVPEGLTDSEFENPYGFVPAVWCKHIDEGDDFGSPAIAGSLAKIDELNGLASHVHDQIDILIDSPGIISTDGNVGLIGQQSKDAKDAAKDEFNAAGAVKEKPTKRLLLKAPKGASWVPLTGNLTPDQTVQNFDRLLAEIEHDFPELSMYSELRKMTQVTGPGAARMMGDVASKVLEVSANYDTQSIKLFQMACAIGGFRFAEGKEGWAARTKQQQKFASFNLQSYAQGQLDIAIMPRELIKSTEDDMVTIAGKRLDNAGKAQGIFNDDKVLEVAGISDESERATILAERTKESQKAPVTAKNAIGSTPPGIQALFGAKGANGVLAGQ